MFTPGSVSGALNPPPYLAALMFQHRGRYFSGLGAASPVKRKAAPRACSPTQRDSHDGKLGDGNKHHHPSVALWGQDPHLRVEARTGRFLRVAGRNGG